MRLVDALSLSTGEQAAVRKLTKAEAGYVEPRDGKDTRCEYCWKFIPETEQCAELRKQDKARANGYCRYWSQGTPRSGLVPMGSYTPEQLLYGEKKNGTLCKRCVNSLGGTCKRVEGRIKPGGCCDLQSPTVDV